MQQSTKQTTQRWRLLILVLRKITKLNIHLRFTVCSVCHLVNMHTPAALQQIFQALYLLHKALHSERRCVTFCCSKQLKKQTSKQLNCTYLLSSLTWTSLDSWTFNQEFKLIAVCVRSWCGTVANSNCFAVLLSLLHIFIQAPCHLICGVNDFVYACL